MIHDGDTTLTPSSSSSSSSSFLSISSPFVGLLKAFSFSTPCFILNLSFPVKLSCCCGESNCRRTDRTTLSFFATAFLLRNKRCWFVVAEREVRSYVHFNGVGRGIDQPCVRGVVHLGFLSHRERQHISADNHVMGRRGVCDVGESGGWCNRHSCLVCLLRLGVDPLFLCWSEDAGNSC